MNPKCEYIKSDGGRCGLDAHNDSKYCGIHNRKIEQRKVVTADNKPVESTKTVEHHPANQTELKNQKACKRCNESKPLHQFKTRRLVCNDCVNRDAREKRAELRSIKMTMAEKMVAVSPIKTDPPNESIIIINLAEYPDLLSGIGIAAKADFRSVQHEIIFAIDLLLKQRQDPKGAAQA